MDMFLLQNIKAMRAVLLELYTFGIKYRDEISWHLYGLMIDKNM